MIVFLIVKNAKMPKLAKYVVQNGYCNLQRPVVINLVNIVYHLYGKTKIRKKMEDVSIVKHISLQNNILTETNVMQKQTYLLLLIENIVQKMISMTLRKNIMFTMKNVTCLQLVKKVAILVSKNKQINVLNAKKIITWMIHSIELIGNGSVASPKDNAEETMNILMIILQE